MNCKICGKNKKEHSINNFCFNKRNWDLTDKLQFTLSSIENLIYLDSFNKKGKDLK